MTIGGIGWTASDARFVSAIATKRRPFPEEGSRNGRISERAEFDRNREKRKRRRNKLLFLLDIYKREILGNVLVSFFVFPVVDYVS